MTALEMIAAAQAMPKTHRVVTTFADGAKRVHETCSEQTANTHADHMERPKIGKKLIDRATGKTVQIVSVIVERI